MVVVVVQMAPFKREIKLQKTVGEGIRIQKKYWRRAQK